MIHPYIVALQIDCSKKPLPILMSIQINPAFEFKMPYFNLRVHTLNLPRKSIVNCKKKSIWNVVFSNHIFRNY